MGDNWGPGRLSDLPKVTQLESNKTKIKIPIFSSSHPLFPPLLQTIVLKN